MFRRFLNIILALNAFLFAVFCLGNVYPGEYASSAAYRLDYKNKWQGKLFRPLIDTIFGKNHCYYSWVMQRNMTQSPDINWPDSNLT